MMEGKKVTKEMKVNQGSYLLTNATMLTAEDWGMLRRWNDRTMLVADGEFFGGGDVIWIESFYEEI